MEEINCIKARNFLLEKAPTFLDEDFLKWIIFDFDLNRMRELIYDNLCAKEEMAEKCDDDNDEAIKEKLWLSLNCVAFNELHEVVMEKLYESFAKDDEFFFEKSKKFADMNVTAEQFGGSVNHAIHFSAAVVELASLDSHKSPLEKFNCLSTTYDCIFAELKSVLIEVIAKYSENETEIPIINNSEITPVLMVVLVKSKLVHLASNLFYIEHFLWTNAQGDHIRYILDSFKMAAEALKEVNEKTMRPPSGEVCRSLDLKGVIEITSPQSDCDGGGVAVLREQRDRISGLIVRATNETNNFV